MFNLVCLLSLLWIRHSCHKDPCTYAKMTRLHLLKNLVKMRFIILTCMLVVWIDASLGPDQDQSPPVGHQYSRVYEDTDTEL